MKVFDDMWDTLQVKITDVIFRMEESPESFAEALLQNLTLSSGAGNYVAFISDGTRWISLGFKGSLSVGS